MAIQMFLNYMCTSIAPSLSLTSRCFLAYLPPPIMSYSGDTIATASFPRQEPERNTDLFALLRRRGNLCVCILFHTITLAPSKWLPCPQERIATRIGWQNWDTSRSCDVTGPCCITLVYLFPSLYVCSTMPQFEFLRPTQDTTSKRLLCIQLKLKQPADCLCSTRAW